MGNEKDGPFAILFTWVGLIAGAIGGGQTGEFAAVVVGAIVLGMIGYWVGKQADALTAWLLFVLGSIIMILINSAIRRFIWALIFQS
jgi:hypothetical protein